MTLQSDSPQAGSDPQWLAYLREREERGRHRTEAAIVLVSVPFALVGSFWTLYLLTLEVIPVLYTIWRTRQLRLAQRKGLPLEQITGAAPAWAGEVPGPAEGVADRRSA